MLVEMTLVALVSVHTMTTEELERYYWDCDTLYMQQQMSGEDLARCLSITYALQDRFPTMSAFREWWEKNRQSEWQKRGYTGHAT